MSQTNKTQITEPLQLFVDIYNRAFGELDLPFAHRRLSFHASTKLYYPQPSEYVSNTCIKEWIVKNPKETIFSCLSWAMQLRQEKEKERIKEARDNFKGETKYHCCLTIRYADTFVVPEGFTLRQILSGLEDEKVEGIMRGLFADYAIKPKDQKGALGCGTTQKDNCGMAPYFAVIDRTYVNVHYSYDEWAKRYKDVPERYTVFLRPTIICVESELGSICSDSNGARILPVQMPLFDGSLLRITGDKVSCDGLVQIISERDLKLAETTCSNYFFDEFQRLHQIPPGITDFSHYTFGESLVLQGLLLKEDRCE